MSSRFIRANNGDIPQTRRMRDVTMSSVQFLRRRHGPPDDLRCVQPADVRASGNRDGICMTQPDE